MKNLIILKTAALTCFLVKYAFGQAINIPSPQSGSDVSWNKNILVYFSKNLDVEKKTVNPEMVLLDFKTKETVLVPEDSSILSVLAFNENIIVATIDGNLKGYSRSGLQVKELQINNPGFCYLSICKIKEEGLFAALLLAPKNESGQGKYEINILKISDSKFRMVKKIPAPGFGSLIYKFDNLWLIGREEATCFGAVK